MEGMPDASTKPSRPRRGHPARPRLHTVVFSPTPAQISAPAQAPARTQVPTPTRTAAPARAATALPSWWRPVTGSVAVALTVLTVFVVSGAPLLHLDGILYHLHLVPPTSHWSLAVGGGVFLGQRVTASVLAGWYVWHRARADGRIDGIVLFLLAEAGFVAAVVLLKYTTGRIGPRYTDDPFAVLAGGNIFPSGHVTGATVLYGAAALIAPAAMRTIAISCAALLSVGVGMGTIALNTHWATDVLGGWLLGVLVLLLAWAATPRVEAWWHLLVARRAARRATLPR